MLGKKVREVGILGQDGRVCFAGGQKDWEILGISHPQVAHCLRGDVKRFRNPFRRRWRKVCIYPDRHAATTGWSMCLEAY